MCGAIIMGPLVDLLSTDSRIVFDDDIHARKTKSNDLFIAAPSDFRLSCLRDKS